MQTPSERGLRHVGRSRLRASIPQIELVFMSHSAYCVYLLPTGQFSLTAHLLTMGLIIDTADDVLIQPPISLRSETQDDIASNSATSSSIFGGDIETSFNKESCSLTTTLQSPEGIDGTGLQLELQDSSSSFPASTPRFRLRHNHSTGSTTPDDEPPTRRACTSTAAVSNSPFTSFRDPSASRDLDLDLDHDFITRMQSLPRELRYMIATHLQPSQLNPLSYSDRLGAFNLSRTNKLMRASYSYLLYLQLSLETVQDGILLGKSFHQQRMNPPTAQLRDGKVIRLNMFAKVPFALTPFHVGHFGIPSTVEKDSITALREMCPKLRRAWCCAGSGPSFKSMRVFDVDSVEVGNYDNKHVIVERV